MHRVSFLLIHPSILHHLHQSTVVRTALSGTPLFNAIVLMSKKHGVYMTVNLHMIVNGREVVGLGGGY